MSVKYPSWQEATAGGLWLAGAASLTWLGSQLLSIDNGGEPGCVSARSPTTEARYEQLSPVARAPGSPPRPQAH